MIVLPFLLLLAAAPAAEHASEQYLDCLTLLAADTERGRRSAQLWYEEGGGADAEHCLAMADIAAGFYKLGAARLELIAERKDAGDDLIRARLYAQAAETWLQADQLEKASAAIKAAFTLAPDSGELHLTAAKVHAARKQYPQVIAAIDTAEQAGFISVLGYIHRGRAELALGATEAAAEDVVRALSLNPKNIDALTLRGDVQRAGVKIDVQLTPVAPVNE